MCVRKGVTPVFAEVSVYAASRGRRAVYVVRAPAPPNPLLLLLPLLLQRRAAKTKRQRQQQTGMALDSCVRVRL